MPTHLQTRLLDLFLYLGSEWILHLLIILSVLSFGVAMERVWHFFRHRGDVGALQVRLNDSLRKNDLVDARAMLNASPSHAATVALVGLDNLGRGAEATEEMIAAGTHGVRLKMERGLAFLGTLGNNAPFIGLFGTVLGIIRAFRDLSSNTADGSAAVMAGIAESLIATAVGLLVALPAVAVFNLFQRTIKTRLANADAVARVLLAHAKSKA